MGISRGNITTNIIKNGLVFNMDAANRASTVPISTITTSFNTIDLSQSGSFSDNGIFDSSTITPSFAFGGIDDYIDAGSSLGVIGTGVRTFSVWLRTSQTSGTQTVLGTRNYNTDGWVIQISLNSILFYNVKGGGRIWSTVVNLSDGDWHHLVIVRDGTANNRIYVDGVSQTLNTQYTQENLTDPQSSKNLLIGAGYNNGGTLYRLFNGNIGPVHIYNRALSAKEVLFNYNGLKSRFGL